MQPDDAPLRERLAAPPPAERILVIRLGALGDVVRTRFAFAALRALYPRAKIDWLVEDRAAAGLEGIRGLDEIVALPRRELRWSRPAAPLRGLGDSVRRLRERRYDLSVDFHGILKSALLAWAAGIPARAGYDRPLSREGSALLLTLRARVSRTHLSRFERNDALVQYLGGAALAAPPGLDLPSAAAPEFAALPERLVVMHPGTSASTLYKRWDPERYAALARRLKDVAGLESLVTWGPVSGEREAAEAVVAQAGGSAHLAPATRSITHLLCLMRATRLFVGSDSGPMHLAALLGLPVLALFGPTDPVENAPYARTRSRVLRRDVGCNPCRLGCPTRSCMAALEVQDAVEAALELLQGA